MKKEIEGNVNLILEKLIAATESMGDVAAQELPLLLTEIINYQIVGGSITIILFSLILYFTIKWIFSESVKKGFDSDTTPIYLIGTFCGGFISVGLFLEIICKFQHTIKAIVAPRLYLLDYLKDFV